MRNDHRAALYGIHHNPACNSTCKAVLRSQAPIGPQFTFRHHGVDHVPYDGRILDCGPTEERGKRRFGGGCSTPGKRCGQPSPLGLWPADADACHTHSNTVTGQALVSLRDGPIGTSVPACRMDMHHSGRCRFNPNQNPRIAPRVPPARIALSSLVSAQSPVKQLPRVPRAIPIGGSSFPGRVTQITRQLDVM